MVKIWHSYQSQRTFYEGFDQFYPFVCLHFKREQFHK